MTLDPPVIVVCGPTASGKTALALDIAEHLGPVGTAEIVNADSMQVYRGMDIGTAKLPVTERRGIPHHLLDVWPIQHSVSVADYQDLARATIAQIHRRGNRAILIGGSGLYITAVIDDFRFPGTDPQLRARWEARLEAEGPQRLHAHLATLDPLAAERILPTNGRRLVRALEVIELTGEPFSAMLPEPAARQVVVPAVQIGLDPQPDLLATRIADRVDQMWDAGLVQEVRTLAADGLADTRTAARALGYAQVLRFLAGDSTEAQARADTITATRRFARRQRSWFRRDSRIRWIDPAEHDLLGTALRTIGG